MMLLIIMNRKLMVGIQMIGDGGNDNNYYDDDDEFEDDSDDDDKGWEEGRRIEE